MRVFLAGIMQGSHLGAVLHNQQYRQRLRELLQRHLPETDVYDPLADHGNSLEYDDQRGRSVFFHHAQLAAEVDLLVAVVPEATMGTAIEMWQARQAGRAVLTISPLAHNWVVRFLSHEVYSDIDEFERALADGRVARRLREILDADRSGLTSE
ncbi:MAG: hypothetical protein AB7U73_11580 [Pirellulales bacterium]